VRQIAELAQRFNPALHKGRDLAEIVVAENGGTKRRVEVFSRESPEIFAD